MITIEADVKVLEQVKQALGKLPKAFENACKKTIKRTLESMRAEMTRQVREVYLVKAGAVRKAIKPIVMRGGEGGSLYVQGKRQSISEFKLSPRSRPKGEQHGVRVAVRRDSGVHKLPHGFLLRDNQPFIRIGRDRKAIKPLTSLAVPQMLNNPNIQEAIAERGQEVFNKTIKFWAQKALSSIKK